MRLPGDHNVSNALAAIALCAAIAQHHDVDMQAASKALLSFTGLPHRMQWIAEIDACQWYNDSKATNVGAAIAAITGLPGRHVLIAGGEAKDADFAELETVAAEHLRAAVLIGRDADKLEAVIGRVVPVQAASSMADAVAAAKRLAQRGDNILLSPACASFDMFDNYEHRGDVFAQHVRELQS